MTIFDKNDLERKGFREVTPGKWAKAATTRHAEPAKNKFNAKKVTTKDGVYDSKREYAFKMLLDEHNIEYVMKEKYILQQRFKYGSEAIRDIVIIPDFTFKVNGEIRAIVDVKGMIMRDFRLKVKMLKRHFMLKKCCVPIMMPRNKAEMSETLAHLKRLLK